MGREYVVYIVLIIIITLPICRFVFTRISLLFELVSCKRKGVIEEYHFTKPLSLFSGIKGEKADLQLMVGNKIVLIKLIGGIGSKHRYEISDYNIWNVYRYLPFALPFLLDPIGVKKVFQVKFELKKEKAVIQSEYKSKEVEVAYLFSPTPLSVKEISHKKEQELLGGDFCHGARILTKKTLRKSYLNHK